MKQLNIALLFLGLVFLCYLVWTVGARELWGQLSALGFGIIPLIISEGAANLAHTMGWRHCLSGPRGSVRVARLFRIAMAGFAINYLTPTASVGGEVSKASLLSSNLSGPAAVSSVLLDKLMTAFAHVLLAVFGSVFLLWHVSLPRQLWISMAVISGLITGGMLIFLLLQKYGKIGACFRWLAIHKWGGASIQKLSGHISAVDDSLKEFYRDRPLDLALSVLWHLIGHSAALLQAWLFLYFLQQPAPLAAVASAGLLSLWCDLLTFAVPLNLGTLEGSRILALKAVGSSAPLGLAFGVATRIAQLFWACFGLVSYGLLTARNPGTAKPMDTVVR